MAKFIQVTAFANGHTILLNSDIIMAVNRDTNPLQVNIMTSIIDPQRGPLTFPVKESPEEIMRMLGGEQPDKPKSVLSS